MHIAKYHLKRQYFGAIIRELWGFVMGNKTSRKDIENFLFRSGGKYLVIGSSMAAVHTVYLIFFHKIGILSMIIYNILSISGYLYYSAEAYKGNRIKEFFGFLVLEIPLSGILSTLTVGWNYRFMLVVTGFIPCVYYFIIFIDDFKRRILTPTIIGSIYSLLYIGIRIYFELNDPIYEISRNATSYELFFTYFNTVISFISIIGFNMFTGVEFSYVRGGLITENSMLDTYATYDPLTGLLNRRSTDKQLKLLYDANYHKEDAFSVIMCDVDHFKLVNDTYGHDVGDVVLKEVAKIIKDQVRDHDIVGRWGGEEFMIVVHDRKVNALILAERIRENVEAHTYKAGNVELNVTITLGVSSYHARSDLKGLIKSADLKLYRGKENGRNQVVS